MTGTETGTGTGIATTETATATAIETVALPAVAGRLQSPRPRACKTSA
jgi:hypothetical protein